MIIRGICCLNVESDDKTSNIQITSIVGRYLEHSRIYMFGPHERQKIYISSADFMSRNTERRVEVALPVIDAALKQKINTLIDIQLKDNVKARRQIGKGEYKKLPVPIGTPLIDSQLELFSRAYAAANTPIPEWLLHR
ncbi:MAG: polyphosphate kinase 1, partial [Christensenella sp.]